MCLGEARGNASLALRIYRSRHPNVRHPADPRVITAAFQRVLENRPIVPTGAGIGGQQCNVRTEEQILDVVRRNPRLGTRTAAKLMRQRGVRVSHWMVHKVLRRNKMHPYKIQKVQALVPGDHERRIGYCRWLLNQQRQCATFIEHVIWTDESTFTRNGMWNRRNAHLWSHTNPYATQQTGHQTRWSVNVWAGIYKDQILGPVFLPCRLDGPRYLDFINEHVETLLDELPLDQYLITWFQHDGAPPHIVSSVRNRLSELLDDRWIGRLHPIREQRWPPRSPDLTPLDFFLWGYVKDRVFNRECESADVMRDRIQCVFQKLREECVDDPTLMPRLHAETQRRALICLEVNGAQFEPYLTRPQMMSDH